MVSDKLAELHLAKANSSKLCSAHGLHFLDGLEAQHLVHVQLPLPEVLKVPARQLRPLLLRAASQSASGGSLMQVRIQQRLAHHIAAPCRGLQSCSCATLPRTLPCWASGADAAGAAAASRAHLRRLPYCFAATACTQKTRPCHHTNTHKWPSMQSSLE